MGSPYLRVAFYEPVVFEIVFEPVLLIIVVRIHVNTIIKIPLPLYFFLRHFHLVLINKGDLALDWDEGLPLRHRLVLLLL